MSPEDSEVRSCARHGRHYRALRRASRRLFAEDFLDVANFALNFSAGLFDGPAILHVPVASGSSCFLFHVAFNFLRRALEFVFRARFHSSESRVMPREDGGRGWMIED